ncbi:MAG: serine/threonine protein kinase [Solirubrobacteraceae bacterium]|nr:serine/threonine protein kinase [Solirubrobacteraceae bacterium]
MQPAETLRGAGVPAPDGELLLGRYRLGRRLGSGGFGTVWQAWDEHLQRDVAVKRIPLDDTDPERAQREAQAAARLSHPGIVALYETGADDEACYLVSELVRGDTLRDLLDRGALSDRDVVVIGAGLCDALAHAHARGVIHRDVKPGNVMVCEQHADGGATAKICDFGIARIVGGEALTRTGDVVGTLAYMAPEQAEGRRITPAVDVYALGLVLYEALTGTNPIRGAGPADTARRVGIELPQLRRVRRDLPEALCDAIDAAVAAAPRAPPTPARLRAALLAAVDQVDDEPGIVEGGPLDDLRTRWTAIQRRYRDPGETGWLREVRDGLTRAGAVAWEEAADEPFVDAPPVEGDAPAPVPRRLLARAFAAATVAPLAALAVTELGPSGERAPVEAGVAAAAAAALVAVLPRAGWLLCAWALEVWLVAAGASGTALVLAVALLPVPLALPLAGGLWSVPAGAPALGALGLATAFPAVAGQAATVARRAALGALGVVWVCAVELLSGTRLLAGPPASAHARPSWEDSAGRALTDAVVPLLTSGLLAVAALWAVAAAVLPLVVRGRSAALDLALAAVWAAALAVCTQALLEALAAWEAAPPRGLALGAVVAALGAVGLRAARRAARPTGPRLP